jgi:hypothetical protein
MSIDLAVWEGRRPLSDPDALRNFEKMVAAARDDQQLGDDASRLL